MTLFPEKMGDWDVWNNIQKIDDLVTYINPEQRLFVKEIDDLLSGKVDSFNCEVQMGSDRVRLEMDVGNYELIGEKRTKRIDTCIWNFV